MSNDNVWYNNFVEYYSHNKDVSNARLDAIESRFSQESSAVMNRAYELYIEQEIHFPQIANLQQYVKIATEEARGDWPVDDLGIPTDDELYAWEVEDGTLPKEVEPRVTIVVPKRITEAYARTLKARRG